MSSHFGVQLELSRYAPASLDAQQHLSSVQFAPSLMYSLPDKLTDYVWIRPYLGAGVNWYRSTVGSTTPGADSTTEDGLGRQVFGGTALAFASAPQFTLSVDYGYRWKMAPLSSVDMNGPGFSVSGHWYVK